jgi:hypothetical protein
MKYVVFHKKDSDFGISWMGSKPPKEILLKEYDKVAVVDCKNLEDVFRVTNHIDDSWQLNSEVIISSSKARSTSVGDVVIDQTGLANLVDHVGWKQVIVKDALTERYRVWEKNSSEAVNKIRLSRMNHEKYLEMYFCKKDKFLDNIKKEINDIY